MTEQSNWREGLKQGDAVLLRVQSGYKSPYLETFCPVQRVTATQVTVDGIRFRKSDGVAIGLSENCRAEIQEDSPYLRNTIENKTVLRNIQFLEYKWAYLPPEFIQSIGEQIAPYVEAIREAERKYWGEDSPL